MPYFDTGTGRLHYEFEGDASTQPMAVRYISSDECELNTSKQVDLNQRLSRLAKSGNNFNQPKAATNDDCHGN